MSNSLYSFIYDNKEYIGYCATKNFTKWADNGNGYLVKSYSSSDIACATCTLDFNELTPPSSAQEVKYFIQNNKDDYRGYIAFSDDFKDVIGKKVSTINSKIVSGTYLTSNECTLFDTIFQSKYMAGYMLPISSTTTKYVPAFKIGVCWERASVVNVEYQSDSYMAKDPLTVILTTKNATKATISCNGFSQTVNIANNTARVTIPATNLSNSETNGNRIDFTITLTELDNETTSSISKFIYLTTQPIFNSLPKTLHNTNFKVSNVDYVGYYVHATGSKSYADGVQSTKNISNIQLANMNYGMWYTFVEFPLSLFKTKQTELSGKTLYMFLNLYGVQTSGELVSLDINFPTNKISTMVHDALYGYNVDTEYGDVFINSKNIDLNLSDMHYYATLDDSTKAIALNGFEGFSNITMLALSSYNTTLKAYGATYTTPPELVLAVKKAVFAEDPKISSSDNTIYSPISISVKCLNALKIMITNNDMVIYESDNVSNTSPIIITMDNLFVGDNVIRVYALGINEEDRAIYTKTVNLKTIKPSISNLTVTNKNNLVDNATTLTWQVQNADKITITVQDEDDDEPRTIATLDGTSQYYSLAPGSLSEGNNNITVNAIKLGTDAWKTDVITSSTKQLKLTRIKPSIKNVSYTALNVDRAITLRWESENQSQAKIKVADETIATLGESAREYVIPVGRLTEGIKTLAIEVIYNGFETLVATYSKDLTFTCDMPIILNLEPSGLDKNIETQTEVTFLTNEYVDRWELTGAGRKVNGTTARNAMFSANSFSKGDNNITLTVYYSPSYNKNIVRTVSRTSTFNGYGSPGAPKLINPQKYIITAKPTFSWENDEEQVAYEYSLALAGEIKASGNGYKDTSINFTDLAAGNNYLLKVRIKNKYGLWSDYTEHVFDITFSNITMPSIYLSQVLQGVEITISGKITSDFKECVIYRDDTLIANELAINDAYIDYLAVPGVNNYKVRVYNLDGGYQDTEYASIDYKAPYLMLLDIKNPNTALVIYPHSQTINYVDDVVSRNYSNKAIPSYYKGITDYRTWDISFYVKSEEFKTYRDYIRNCDLVAVKDHRGDMMIGTVRLSDTTPNGRRRYEFNLSVSEAELSELNLFKGEVKHSSELLSLLKMLTDDLDSASNEVCTKIYTHDKEFDYISISTKASDNTRTLTLARHHEDSSNAVQIKFPCVKDKSSYLVRYSEDYEQTWSSWNEVSSEGVSASE